MTRHHAMPLAAKLTDLWLATPQVMAIRLSRMMVHGANPSPSDRAEMHRMGSEKVSAFAQSWMAMCMNWWLMPLRLAPALVQSLGGSPRSRNALTHAMSRASTALITAGVTPVHRAAVANRKRLTRR